MAQIESHSFHNRKRSVTKSILITFYFHTGNSISWSSPPGYMGSTFTYWHTILFDTKLAIFHFISFHQYISIRSWCIFVKLGWTIYRVSGASTKIFLVYSSISRTYNLSWYIKIPSPPISKTITFYLLVSSLILIKRGSNMCFSFILEQRDNYGTYYTNIHPSSEFKRQTQRLAKRWRSFTSSLLSSSTWAILPMDNLLRVPSTTLALPGRYHIPFAAQASSFAWD